MRPLDVDEPTVVGPYRLLGRLGSGGMGRVCLGRSAGGRTVAVKIVHPHFALDEEFRARFRREVDAARRVGGAWTASVLDADPEARVPWVATAYAAGPSLAAAVTDSGPLPAHTVRTLGAGLAEALTAVHELGLVHRDVKPSNVLLRQPAAGHPRAGDLRTAGRLKSGHRRGPSATEQRTRPHGPTGRTNRHADTGHGRRGGRSAAGRRRHHGRRRHRGRCRTGAGTGRRAGRSRHGRARQRGCPARHGAGPPVRPRHDSRPSGTDPVGRRRAVRSVHTCGNRPAGRHAPVRRRLDRATAAAGRTGRNVRTARGRRPRLRAGGPTGHRYGHRRYGAHLFAAAVGHLASSRRPQAHRRHEGRSDTHTRERRRDPARRRADHVRRAVATRRRRPRR
ncbi:protein kinase [Streptomyces sp. SM1]|uniref:protein kinase domain-containing protein n=1 Tax=Streptomyces sp. SM1 TaxID=402229 RepID=UPI0021564417|nr:protein kinase [Streptomyces sp. SM1]